MIPQSCSVSELTVRYKLLFSPLLPFQLFMFYQKLNVFVVGISMPLAICLLTLLLLKNFLNEVVLILYVCNSLIQVICLTLLIIESVQEDLLFLIIFRSLSCFLFLMLFLFDLICLQFEHVMNKILSGITSLSFELKEFLLFM